MELVCIGIVYIGCVDRLLPGNSALLDLAQRGVAIAKSRRGMKKLHNSVDRLSSFSRIYAICQII